MRILFNRISNRISGAEIYNILLLASLKKYKDLDITFTSDVKDLNLRLKKIGYDTEFINPGIQEIGTKRHLLLTLLLLPVFYYRYFKLFKKIGTINLIVFESMTEKLFLTPFLKNVIWIEHGPLFVTQRAWLIKFLYLLNSRFIKKIICVSKSTQNDLVTGGIKKSQTEIIYIGINTKKYAPLTNQLIAKIKKNLHIDHKDVIAFLGTVNKEKGIDDFLSVACFLLKLRKNIFFIVIGDGELLSWSKQKVKDLSIDRDVLFTGFVEDIRDYLGIADVLLFPTKHDEGLSISLIEACSMGVPVVASNKEGVREIIQDNENGKIYKTASEKSISRDIVELLSKKRYYKANAGLSVDEKFSSEKSSKLFHQIFLTYGK